MCYLYFYPSLKCTIALTSITIKNFSNNVNYHFLIVLYILSLVETIAKTQINDYENNGELPLIEEEQYSKPAENVANWLRC